MRPLRVNATGAWHHLTSRGVNRATLFHVPRDYQHFLELLEEAVERFGIHLHAYVLMPNHFHLLTETPKGNVSAVMQWLKLSYSAWYNRKRGRTGPVFGDRFRGVLVEGGGSWALEASRYLHLNPVRVKGLGLSKGEKKAEGLGWKAPDAETVRRRLATLREYPWSSYRTYAGYASKPTWLTGEELWRRTTRKGQDKRTAYRRYVEDGLRQGVEEKFWDRAKVGMVLGGEKFCETVRRLVHGDRREQREVREWERRGTWETVVRGVEKAKREKWEGFRDRQGDWGRDLALWIARRRCGYTLRELGKMAGGIEYPAVAKAVERIGFRLSRDRTLARLCTEVMEGMSNV